MKLLENKWFWVCAFGMLLALSIDLWAWNWTEPSILGLPYIIAYTIFLEAALFVLFVLFCEYYWVEKQEES